MCGVPVAAAAGRLDCRDRVFWQWFEMRGVGWCQQVTRVMDGGRRQDVTGTGMGDS